MNFVYVMKIRFALLVGFWQTTIPYAGVQLQVSAVKQCYT